jgi:hypothetical protein
MRYHRTTHFNHPYARNNSALPQEDLSLPQHINLPQWQIDEEHGFREEGYLIKSMRAGLLKLSI